MIITKLLSLGIYIYQTQNSELTIQNQFGAIGCHMSVTPVTPKALISVEQVVSKANQVL